MLRENDNNNNNIGVMRARAQAGEDLRGLERFDTMKILFTTKSDSA